MTNKKSCILYDSWGELFIGLPKNLAGEIIQAISIYAFKGEIPEFEDPAAPGIFAMIKQKLDEDAEKYEKESKRRSEAGKNGMRKRWESITNDNTAITNDKTVITNDNTAITQDNNSITKITDSVSDSDSVSDTVSPSEIKKHTPAQHRRGEYAHVMLSDEEVEKLDRDFGNAQELIAFLDEYKERKGYKCKNDYLTIRKWVVDAVRKEKGRASPDGAFDPTQYILSQIGSGAYDEG